MRSSVGQKAVSSALYRPPLDDFLQNPLKQGHSRITSETSRITFGANQGTNEDDSQSHPHPEATVYQSQITQNTDPDDEFDIVIGVPKGVTYCSPGTSSGKQKKNPSANQPQFRSQNTAAMIETDHTLLPLQQLAINNNSAIFKNNIHTKLPTSRTTTIHTFDRKSEGFELFEDFFRTSPKIGNQLTEDDKINYFQFLMRGDALRAYKNINSSNPRKIGINIGSFP